MSLSSHLQAAQAVNSSPRTTGTNQDKPAALLAYGLLEELYRRRNALAVALIMGLCLLAAAVGQRVWVDQGSVDVGFAEPSLTASNSSADLQGGPTGTWQRWGDLGSEKRSQSSVVPYNGSSTTTFATSNTP